MTTPAKTKGEGTYRFLQIYGLLTFIAGVTASAVLIGQANTVERAWAGIGILLATAIWSAVMWGLGVALEHAIWIRQALERLEAREDDLEPAG